MTISPDHVLFMISAANTIAGFTPASVILCPILSVAGQMYGGYIGMQAEEANSRWQHSVDNNLISINNNLAVLESTTALIGLGTGAGATISAVNLYQTIKLRQEVKELKLRIHAGFIDLKKALKDQGEEVMRQIDKVADDVEYIHHLTILARAYGKFIHAVNWLRDTVKLTDVNAITAAFVGIQGKLVDALADYTNPEIYKHNSVPGRLRRMECAWAIEQTITMVFQLQGAPDVVSQRLSSLHSKIRKELVHLINLCESQEELDFIFPEIARIHNHDLAALKLWQEQVDLMRSLSPEDLKELENACSEKLLTGNKQKQEVTALAEPPEQLLYNELREKSHFLSLRDQLRFVIQPESRKEHESYISQQANNSNYPGLAPSNWQEITDLTVANLYWYFKKPKPSFT
ncbi:hypothetical protein IQ264_15980 [Phormidium sp. LEGE 05292]|uniref:hypothetical protein n=1 Tax=[Phormidium] sp. LEGE 05292 TaxID=767427 RepID=UPI001880DE0D|nr:hypothetical protein [Phormidium sp. LEGE 05292]MBE9226927.1 hypothetical protein [Phormidium sp. LEGE 05292]